MKVEIQFQTQYSYDEPVSFSIHLFRLFPKLGRHLSVSHAAFSTNLDARVSYRRDLFDNEIASAFYPEKSALLAANLQLRLEVAERNAFDFLLESHAFELPFVYKPEEMHVLAPFCDRSARLELPFWKAPTKPRQTVEALTELNFALHENIAYERREEGPPRAPHETLALGRGSCRDYAVLLAEALRQLGLAARLASGYLCEFGEEERRAEGALHAWTEAYLPGAGWVGFDPTNGILCNHNHITAAVGLTPADIAPILGRYFHPTHVPSQMATSLHIHEIV